MVLASGSRFGSYEILSLLGVGGMGEVYRALDGRLQREVAVKVLPDALHADPERRSRFEREARTASNLNHPNILTIFEIGDVEGTHFMAAELVAGETLGMRLKRGPLPLDGAMELAAQIAAGVAAAHDVGIVHRDLKPDNVMIRPDGLVKVLDFGLARPIEQPPADADLQTRAATTAGTVAGTVRYMSPEQARGLPIDARSDVFSLGVMLYEMLCGVPPFAGATSTDVMVAILERTPEPLAVRRPDTPRELQTVVSRCLEKTPDARYGSARELRDALQKVATAWSRGAPASDEAPSVAVLPFANVSADPENEYFCDGIADEIMSALGKVTQLQVAGRTSAFSFKGKTGDLREIGRALNVGAVLEGSVRKAGNRLRITAQLVKVADGFRLWSERYDRQMEDIFEIQDEIALAVVEALKVTLLGGEKAEVVKRSTENAEAYNLCLKARHTWASRWTDEAVRSATVLFERALELDPGYAVAYFGLADCRAAWMFSGMEPVDLPLLRELWETALRLDPTLVEVDAVYGMCQAHYEWKWAEGEARCRRALALKPRSGQAHIALANVLAVSRPADAMELYVRGVELDPLSSLWNAMLAQAALATGDAGGALRYAQSALELSPHQWWAHLITGQAHETREEFPEAIRSFEQATAAGCFYPIGALGHALARAGMVDDARAKLHELTGHARSRYVPPVAFAWVHAGLGEVDDAFHWLDRARQERDAALQWAIGPWPSLRADLDSDPRFAALRRSVGL
jgi:serine/threonine-protein kinase